MGFRVGGAENYTSRLWFLACQPFGSMAIVFTFVYDTRCPVRDVYCDEQGRYMLLESPSDPTTCVILNWDLSTG